MGTLFLIVFGVTAIVIGGGMLAMAVGVIGSGRCLRGSCGGAPARDARGERLSCAGCPNRASSDHEGEAARHQTEA